MSGETRTFRGLSLAEVEAKVRAELGDDAVVVRQREGLTGGVGGFFQRRVFEVEATAGPSGGPQAAAVQLSPGAPTPAPAATSPASRTAAKSTAPAAAPAMPAPAATPAAPPAENFLTTLKAALGPELEQAAAEQRAAQAAADFVPDALAAAARVEQASAEPARPANGHGAALAALFAPDAPRAAVAWPEEDEEPAPVVVAQAPPEPAAEILPAAPASAPAGPPAHWPAGAARVQTRLLDRGLSSPMVAEVLDEVVTNLLPFASNGRIKPLVASALARRIPAAPLRGAGGRVVGFVGPGGAGKTRCVARLAHAYAVRTPAPVTCVTLRAEDDGAELRRLLAPCGVPVLALDDAAEARTRLDRLPDDALVLVDTPGVSPRAEAELRALANELRQLRLDETHLALPATMGPDAGRDLVVGTRSLGVDALALTHADETERLGTAIELAIETGLPLSYIGRGTIISGGLRPALPEELAAVVLS
ncbi:MAG TPA: hypothetical protein VGJ32_04435 [Solirubrobacteraceae bacterium]